MLSLILLFPTISLLLGQSYAADSFSMWNYDCIRCVLNKGYFCDYSRTFINTGSCSSSSFTLCTNQYTSVFKGCVESFGGETSFTIGYGMSTTMTINGATIYVDGLDMSFMGPLNSKIKINLENPSATNELRLNGTGEIMSMYV